MKIMHPALFALSIAAGGSLFAAAQEMHHPPKVLLIEREFLKPGKGGSLHDKSEGKFVADMAAAKWPTHYIALNSMSGKSRALYLIGYDSFASMEKDNNAFMKDTALSASLDRDTQADGELLDNTDQFVFTLDDDLSYRPDVDIAQVRDFEITSFHIKPGHGKEWHELVALVIEAQKKGGTSAHWATYEIAYGGDNEYVAFSADKSLAEIDTGYAEDKQFHDALGDEGLKKLRDLEADCIQESDSELFSINPAQSYPMDEWVKAAPDFWKPKHGAPAAKPATKPAAKPAQ
ncbi:MAG TPA: hypothetical protein VGG45_12975 [Terracidiphilus sp.]|jgi:hypothetical protein